MAFSAEYVYRILDRYSGPLDRISRATDKFKAKAAATAQRVDRISNRMEKMSQKMANFRTAIGGAALTAGMFKFAAMSSNMADAMADVQRVTGLNDKQLAALQSRLQLLGRETGRSALGFAAIAYEGGKLGIANRDLSDFVLMVTKTAAAFDMVDAEAGRAIGSIRAKLGLSVSSVNELMQRVNFLADNTSAAGAQMIEIIERTSGTFKTLGIPPAVSAGWAAFANQVEVTPELAASGLNMMMSRMMKMPGMLEKLLKDPKNAVINFLKRFEAMPEATRGTKILKVFGDEAGRFVLKAVANMKLLDEAMGKAASSRALGSMDREFANILARSSTAAKRVKETFIDIGRAIGGVFLRMFDRYSDSILKISNRMLAFVKLHPGLVKLAGGVSIFLAALAAVVVPLGILFSIIAGGLPIITAISAAVAGISMPVVAAVAGITAFVTWIGWALARSAMFRQSLVNIADSFSPLINGLKVIAGWIGKELSASFEQSQIEMQTWGDVLSVIINGVAGLIKGLLSSFEKLGTMMGAISMGNFKDAWSAAKSIFSAEQPALNYGVSMPSAVGVAGEKAASRKQDNRVEISGQIGVAATGNSEVKKADIRLNRGYNLAVSP